MEVSGFILEDAVQKLSNESECNELIEQILNIKTEIMVFGQKTSPDSTQKSHSSGVQQQDRSQIKDNNFRL